jgi:hypothetical protein
MAERITDDGLTWQERRNRGLADIASVIEKIWGHRCNQHDGHCGGCHAWTIFDCLAKLTDTDILALNDEIDGQEHNQMPERANG